LVGGLGSWRSCSACCEMLGGSGLMVNLRKLRKCLPKIGRRHHTGSSNRDLHMPKCGVCGCIDRFDFYVPDEVWESVVPEEYRDRAICLSCFDYFAYRENIDYSSAISDTIYFAGNTACFFLKLEWRGSFLCAPR